eukprot:2885482-Amphidinium_carterae.1
MSPPGSTYYIALNKLQVAYDNARGAPFLTSWRLSLATLSNALIAFRSYPLIQYSFVSTSFSRI